MVANDDAEVRLFLCGDVMLGRGIDQILPRPSDPVLYEAYMRSAAGYIEIAERVSGPIPRRADLDYPWGDALALLNEARVHARIVNLETAVTTSDDAQAGKGIHYRMHPDNVGCLVRAGVDCCVLANNHVIDWGRAGLAETLATLHRAGMSTAGAGRDASEAETPATIALAGGRRVLVLAYALPTAGVPADWAATADRSGVGFLPDLRAPDAERVVGAIGAARRAGDIVVVSLHWGGNWGYAVTADARAFAHRLIDGGADIVHGHSSHHVRGIEVYRRRPILYGCGDFINDYEGITGHEAYRPDLAVAYLLAVDTSDGALKSLRIVPLRRRRFRLERASRADAAWLRATLEREGAALGTRVTAEPGGALQLAWSG